MPSNPALPSALKAELEAMEGGIKAKPDAAPAPVAQPSQEHAPATDTPPAPLMEPGETPVEPAKNMNKGASALANTANPATRNSEDSEFKHKYDVLNGKYRKETADLRDENKRLKEELERKAQAEPSTDILKPVSSDPQSVTEEELVAEYGQDYLDEMGPEYCRREYLRDQKIKQVIAEHERRFEELQSHQSKQNESAFVEKLNSLVPNWPQINDSQAWSDFLGTMNRVAGNTYEGLLNDAHEAFDAERVAEIFRTFLSTEPAAKTGFDRLVMPSAQAPSGQPAAKKTMTTDQWIAAMQELTSGRYSPMEAQKRQKELQDIMNKGMVTD